MESVRCSSIRHVANAGNVGDVAGRAGRRYRCGPSCSYLKAPGDGLLPSPGSPPRRRAALPPPSPSPSFGDMPLECGRRAEHRLGRRRERRKRRQRRRIRRRRTTPTRTRRLARKPISQNTASICGDPPSPAPEGIRGKGSGPYNLAYHERRQRKRAGA